MLPRFWVAPLEAGGQLLLSPANLPHCVITLQDCVMVEMRKIFKLFLDEVHYFQARRVLVAGDGWLVDVLRFERH